MGVEKYPHYRNEGATEMKGQTPDEWHWKITPEQIARIKAGDRETVDRVYMDNLDKFRAIAWRYCEDINRLDIVQDCIQQIYVDLPTYNFNDTGKLYWSIRNSFRAAGMLSRRPCVSLETPLTDNGEITLADTIAGADGFAELEEQESVRAVLDMIAEQTQLTEKQRDQLTALAFGVALYRGIYAEEYRYAHTVNA